MILKCFCSKLFPNNRYRSTIKYRNYCEQDSPSKFVLNDKTIRLLEKLALVNFENRRYVEIVERAIEFANVIDSVKADNVEPLVTVLENCPLKLRKDLVTDGNLKVYILQNAAVVEEDYFVAPPGNIPANLQTLKSS